LPTKHKGAEDEQIQSALEQFETFNAFLGRHPTREYVHVWVGCQPKMESEIRGRSPDDLPRPLVKVLGISWMTGYSSPIGLGKSFAWACGPPIDMKIKSSRNVYDQATWNGKDRGNSGGSA
jgi:hypothetical protein